MIVKEVMITKGNAVKKLTVMGRGRTGFGYTRESHVTIKVDKVDFQAMIDKAKSPEDKKRWEQRWEIVKKLKEEPSATVAVAV